MKNLSLPTYLLLCFFMLMMSTPAQAITATTATSQTAPQVSAKQQAKIERLKKKLSKKMAKMNPNPTEAEIIQRKAKETLVFGLASFLSFVISFTGIIFPFVGLLFFLAIPLAIVSLSNARKAKKAIAKSKNPEAYQEEMKKVKKGRGYAIATLSILIGLVGFLLYYFRDAQV